MASNKNLQALRDLLKVFHSRSAAKARTQNKSFEELYGNYSDLTETVARIRTLVDAILDYEAPELTIAIPIYNEETEIIPTVLSFLYCLEETGVRAEMVATNNNSTDRSEELLNALGIKVVFRADPGLRYARHSGLEASNDSCEFIWFIDADTRAIPPLLPGSSQIDPRSALAVSYKKMKDNPRCIAVSTGVEYEYRPLLRRIIAGTRRVLGKGPKISCWSGANQFLRKKQLIAAGGVDLSVDGGEDHNRLYSIVRFARKNNFSVEGADNVPELYAPVFTSDRRNASVVGMTRNIAQQLRKPAPPIGSDGLPVHPKNVRYKDLHRRERGKAKLD